MGIIMDVAWGMEEREERETVGGGKYISRAWQPHRIGGRERGRCVLLAGRVKGSVVVSHKKWLWQESSTARVL